MPQRFLTGVSSVAASDPLAELPYLDPTKWMLMMNDMLVLPTSLGWTNTNTAGTLAVASGAAGCGVATQTMGGADDNLSQLYMTTATMALVANKQAFFEAKVRVDKGAGGTIGQQELFAGLCTVQTGANFFAGDGLSMTVDDCVGFSSYDGSTNLNAVARISDVESAQVGASTYADATYYVLTWYFNGSYIIFYVDGTEVARLFKFPTGAMTPCLYIRAGEGAASVLTTDYVFVAIER